MLAGILGSNFGGRDPRRDLIEGEIAGTHRFRGGTTGRTKRPSSQRQRSRSGTARRTHRRSYLSGKPGL